MAGITIPMAVAPIGITHSPWTTKGQAPIQGAMRHDARGSVVVNTEFAAGLRDLEGFSHLILLYWFDRAGEVRMVRAPFLDDDEHGLFAMRHPARPNPIGITVVRLLGLDGPILTVAGIDVLDGTPLLDIKPYVPQWDSVPNATTGWLRPDVGSVKPEGRE